MNAIQQTGTQNQDRNGSFASQAHQTAIETTPEKTFKNEICANEVINGTPERFDAIEIHGARNHLDPSDPTMDFCEVDNESPEFYSVFLHFVEGGIATIADLKTHEMAQGCAKQLAEAHGWPIYDHTLVNARGA